MTKPLQRFGLAKAYKGPYRKLVIRSFHVGNVPISTYSKLHQLRRQLPVKAFPQLLELACDALIEKYGINTQVDYGELSRAKKEHCFKVLSASYDECPKRLDIISPNESTEDENTSISQPEIEKEDDISNLTEGVLSEVGQDLDAFKEI